ncbi:O-antigen ligase family protein [Streptomyces sp. NPDC002790]|uniref:O-antigen ligase family protein n=1 Tax=Streptomyces sp. NPDC002790 TaxID=3154431 RepID=UPI003322D496
MDATGWSTGAATDGTLREHRGASDAVGVAVLGCCAAWSLISATARAGRPEGILLAVLAVIAGYACGRIGGALVPVAASCAVGLGGLCLALTAPYAAPAPDVVTPLGRVGATAALLALSAGALCCAAWSARQPPQRVVLHVLAAGSVAVAAAVDSPAGITVCAGVVLCSLAAARLRSRALGLTGLGLATSVVAGLGVALAKGVLPAGSTASLETWLSHRRILLWHDAVHLAEVHPALGTGPGRFEDLSPTLAQAPLSDGKPHSAVLQVAAEQGLIGVLLLAAAYCWLLYVLWRSARSTQVVLAAGAALTAVAAMATVGNALSFTTVTAGVGLLAGIATAEPFTNGPPGDDEAALEFLQGGLD